MTTEAVQKGRATVSTEAGGLQIVIPSRKQVFAMLFLPVWLCGWAFGEVTAAQSLLHGRPGKDGTAFLAFWLTMWTAGGVLAILSFAWSLAGREILTFGSGALTWRRAIGPFGYDKSYDLHQVKDLRAVPAPIFGRRQGLEAWGMSGGQIAFDYGARTINVGNGVDEAEAKQLVEQVKRRYNV